MKTSKDFYPGWKMTPSQRRTYFNEMGNCAEMLGCPLEETRKRVHMWAFKAPRSAKDINHKADFDELKKVWSAIMRGDDLDAQMALHDQPNKRIIHLIKYNYLPSLAVLLAFKNARTRNPSFDLQFAVANRQSGFAPNFDAAQGYLNAILKNRFKVTDIKDLSVTQPSTINHQLHQFRDTIAGRISALRRELDLTVHDLNHLAGIPCDCADCQGRDCRAAQSVLQPHHKELVA